MDAGAEGQGAAASGGAGKASLGGAASFGIDTTRYCAEEPVGDR
jgi:hypothetical protein